MATRPARRAARQPPRRPGHPNLTRKNRCPCTPCPGLPSSLTREYITSRHGDCIVRLLAARPSFFRYGHDRMRESAPSAPAPVGENKETEKLGLALLAGLWVSRPPSCSRCFQDPVLLSSGSGPRHHGTNWLGCGNQRCSSLENHGFEAPLPERLQVLQPVSQPGLAGNLFSQPGPEKERSQIQDRMHDVQVCLFLTCAS